jgi:hypothetical protein
VGLTLVYAISGVAVNHVQDWNPSYRNSRTTWHIPPPGTGPTPEITPLVLERLDLPEPVRNTWRASPEVLRVFVEGATLDVDLTTGEVQRQGLDRRAVLFEMNALHLNQPRGAWTLIADVYAGVLIVLAVSGLFLVRGRRGLAGRGGLLMGIGILVPVIAALWFRL